MLSDTNMENFVSLLWVHYPKEAKTGKTGAPGLGTNSAVVSCVHSGLHGAEALLEAMAVCGSVFSIFQLILN